MSIYVEMLPIMFKGVKIAVYTNDTNSKTEYAINNPISNESIPFTNLKKCKLAITQFLETSDTGSINTPEPVLPVTETPNLDDVLLSNALQAPAFPGTPAFDFAPGEGLMLKATFLGLVHLGTPIEIVDQICKSSLLSAQTPYEYMVGFAHRYRLMYQKDIDTSSYYSFLLSLNFYNAIDLVQVSETVWR